MTPILISIIVFLAVAVAVLAVFARKEAGKHPSSKAELTTGQVGQSGIIDKLVGICEVAVETASQKEERKQRIMTLLGGNEIPPPSGAPFTKGEWGNAEIRKALGVSSRTAVRYLDELEKEGKVEQVGKIGHAVTYRLPPSH